MQRKRYTVLEATFQGPSASSELNFLRDAIEKGGGLYESHTDLPTKQKLRKLASKNRVLVIGPDHQQGIKVPRAFDDVIQCPPRVETLLKDGNDCRHAQLRTEYHFIPVPKRKSEGHVIIVYSIIRPTGGNIQEVIKKYLLCLHGLVDHPLSMTCLITRLMEISKWNLAIGNLTLPNHGGSELDPDADITTVRNAVLRQSEAVAKTFDNEQPTAIHTNSTGIAAIVSAATKTSVLKNSTGIAAIVGAATETSVLKTSKLVATGPLSRVFTIFGLPFPLCLTFLPGTSLLPPVLKVSITLLWTAGPCFWRWRWPLVRALAREIATWYGWRRVTTSLRIARRELPGLVDQDTVTVGVRDALSSGNIARVVLVECGSDHFLPRGEVGRCANLSGAERVVFETWSHAPHLTEESGSVAALLHNVGKSSAIPPQQASTSSAPAMEAHNIQKANIQKGNSIK